MHTHRARVQKTSSYGAVAAGPALRDGRQGERQAVPLLLQAPDRTSPPQDLNGHSAAHVVTSFVSSEMLKCRLSK